MDRQSVYSTHVFDANFNESEDTALQIQAQLENFILNFRLENKFIYRYVFAPYHPRRCGLHQVLTLAV